jgi:hypothetical protein
MRVLAWVAADQSERVQLPPRRQALALPGRKRVDVRLVPQRISCCTAHADRGRTSSASATGRRRLHGLAANRLLGAAA